MQVLENVALAPRTTLGLGGAARFFVEAASEAILLEAQAWAQTRAVPVFLLGGGSNIVVSDRGVDGLVIALRPGGTSFTPDGGATAWAGDDWNGFVDACIARHFAGIECLAGIPGTVGATPVQNVGAYGQEVAETIASVRALDLATGETATIWAADCAFAYRRSRFNHGPDFGRFAILSVTFHLRPGGAATLRYKELQQRFADTPNPSLAAVAAAVRAIRAAKGMVIDPSDPDSRSAGSFFKNPTVDAAAYTKLEAQGAPGFVQPEGGVKVPAAWLIERAGLTRGQALAGDMRISSKHVLALVNGGAATASDLCASAILVQERVFARLGVQLVPEPLFVGFDPANKLPTGAQIV